MANTVSSLKRVRTTANRTEVNRARKTKLRHAIRSLRRLIAAKDANAAVAELPKTFSVIDKAAKQGVIKKNTAARYKSRVTKHVKALQAA